MVVGAQLARQANGAPRIRYNPADPHVTMSGSPVMTRRTFLGTVGTTVVGGGAQAWTSRPLAPDRDVWGTAQRVVRSGVLGTIVWGQIAVPSGPGSEAGDLEALLNAMGVRERPRRVTSLTTGAASTNAGGTTIVEFASHPPVYVARGPRAATIRGTRARLHVNRSGVRLVPVPLHAVHPPNRSC
jgi:hypothetical protein